MINNFEENWSSNILYKYSDITNGSYSVFTMSSSKVFTKLKEDSKYTFTKFISFEIRSKSNNNEYKNYFLKYPEIVDIYTSLQSASTNPNLFKEIITITKKYKSDKVLNFDFLTTSTNEKVIQVKIMNSSSDFQFIIIPFMEFLNVYSLLKEYKTNYVEDVSNTSNMLFLLESQILQTNYLKSEIINLKSLLLNNLNNNNNLELINEKQINNDNDLIEPKVLDINNDFQTFLDDNIENVIVPGLDTLSTSFDSNKLEKNDKKDDFKISSFFMESILNQDFSNINLFSRSILENDNYIEYLNKITNDRFLSDQDIYDVNDYKSHLYISKFVVNSLIKNCNLNNIRLPSLIPPINLKYDIKINNQNFIPFMYDILFSIVYIQVLRNKIGVKNEKDETNYSNLCLTMRMIFDPFVFNLINNINEDEMIGNTIIRNCVLSRYKSFKMSGYLKEDLNELVVWNCSPVSNNDIIEELDKYLKTIREIKNDIKIVHGNGISQGKFRIPYDNSFTFEQINNEIIKCELVFVFKDDELVNVTQDKQILKFFKNKPISSNIQQSTHLERFFKEDIFKKEIPVDKYDDIFKYVSSLKNNVFEYSKFSLEELGDNVVKAIYIWNEESDEKRGKGNYTDFRYKIENSMSKDLILSKIMSESNIEFQTDNNNNDEWLEYINI